MAEGWPTLGGGKLQPDITHVRHAHIKLFVDSIAADLDTLNSLSTTISIRELESAGVLSTRSTCLYQLIQSGLGKDERGMP